jgi:hypothetical protein
MVERVVAGIALVPIRIGRVRGIFGGRKLHIDLQGNNKPEPVVIYMTPIALMSRVW